jgi:hypothetical protein
MKTEPAIKIVRIKRSDWERVQRHAVAFETFAESLTRVLNGYDAYAADAKERCESW